MKVLIITPYVSLAGRPEFERNKTGFGYMVHDIAKAVGESEEVDVLATDSRGGGFFDENVHYIKRSFISFFRYLSKSLPLKHVTSLFAKYNIGRKNRIRLWYYWFMTGYISKTISTGAYDIVHIHGCIYSDDLWMAICKKHNVKYIVTLHGLNSFSNSVKIDASGKKYERDFLRRVVEGEFPITVISTGIKQMIEEAYNTKNCKNITVVCNSFDFRNYNNNHLSIRKKYDIPQNAKILLYVGNISKNKNQIQMMQAFGLLPERLRKETYVLFCGANHLKESEINRTILKTPDADHLIFCGPIEKEVMPCYYKEADGVVLLSYAEGFGLSLIEGMHFGVPCAMLTDFDAFNDIFDICAVQPVPNRENETVAKSIETLLTKKWNHDAIIIYSDSFSIHNMGKKYINSYQQ